MTYQKIYETVQQIIEDTSSDSLIRIKDWINEAQQVISQSKDWAFLQAESTFDTVSGDEEYSLDSDLAKLGQVRITTSGYERILGQADYADFTRNHPAPTNETNSTPLVYYPSTLDSSGYQQIKLYPIPDVVYTIKYNYKKILSDLSNSTDVSKIPARYHFLLIKYPCYQAFLAMADSRYIDFLRQFKEGLIRMKNDYGTTKNFPIAHGVSKINDL